MAAEDLRRLEAEAMVFVALLRTENRHMMMIIAGSKLLKLCPVADLTSTCKSGNMQFPTSTSRN